MSNYNINDLRLELNIDQYILILNDLIYNHPSLSPQDSFNFYKKEYCSRTFNGRKISCVINSIIKIIVDAGQIDYMQNLYDNNICIHTSTDSCICVLGDIIDCNNLKYFDLMINNNWDPIADNNLSKEIFNRGNKYYVSDEIIMYFIDKCEHNKKFIQTILNFCIKTFRRRILKNILDNMNYYQITVEDLNNRVLEITKTHDIDGYVLKMLEDYGFEIDIHKDKILCNLLERIGNSNQILYLLSHNPNLDNPIYDKLRLVD